MGQGSRIPARTSSIRFVTSEDDDEEQDLSSRASRFEDRPYDESPSRPRRQIPSFQFNFDGSPVLGESATTPPVPEQLWFRSDERQHGHARTSSQAVPWLPTQQTATRSSRDRPRSLSPDGLSPPPLNESRFSRNTSSPSGQSGTASSPTAVFSPPAMRDDHGQSQDPERGDYTVQSSSEDTSSPSFDSSPPPIPLRRDQSLPRSPRTPPTPSAWRTFFAPAPQGTSRFSASTISPTGQARGASPSPSPPSTASSSSSSFDGTALPHIPPAIAIPPRRVNNSSYTRYSHAYPTTYLEAINEDASSISSIASPPPIPPRSPKRSPDRPRTQDRQTQTSPGSQSDEEGQITTGTAAALAVAAGDLVSRASSDASNLRQPERLAKPPLERRMSVPPQLPPLEPLDLSTKALQRLFSFYPAPRMAYDTPHLEQQPFAGQQQPLSPGSSLLTFSSVKGPNGERFSALREKRLSHGVYWPDSSPTKSAACCGVRGMSWKLWAAVLILLVITFGVIAVGVGVGVGLGGDRDGNVANGRADNDNAPAGNMTSGTAGGDPNQPPRMLFPVGTFAIMTTLRNVSTACSNISATWSCASGAGQTFWEGINNSSVTTVIWTVTQNNATGDADDDGFRISSSNDPFALRFSGAPLTLREVGGRNEHWEFVSRVRKRVRPAVDVSGRNVAVECDYDSVDLTGRLFTQRPSDPALGGGTSAWPGAVDVEEISTIQGSCAEVQNGVRGRQIPVTRGGGECHCMYSGAEQ